MANILTIFSSSPYAGHAAQEGLEFALAQLAFEHDVHALFIGEGVALLQPETIASAPFVKGFLALPLHGIARVGADREDLRARGAAETSLAVEQLSADDVRQWISQSHVVLQF